MDIDFLRSIITVFSFVCFITICLWAYSARARAGFEEAANIPFADDSANLPFAKDEAIDRPVIAAKHEE